MLDQEVQAAADRGELVQAIKLLRERTGLGLKDAKDAVEAYLRGEKVHSAPADQRIPAAAVSALHEGKLLHAIRHTRDATRMGLKDSKEAVERYLAANPLLREQYQEAARRERRPMRTIFILALLVAAIVVLVSALGR